MADVPAGAQPATPREVLAEAYLAEYNSNASAAHRALSSLSAAGFEVLPRALVDAVLDRLPVHEPFGVLTPAIKEAIDALAAYREQS